PDPVHFVQDVNHDELIYDHYAREEGLRSAALFRLETKDQSIVIAFGFSTQRDFSGLELHLYSLAGRLSLLASIIDWPVGALTVLAEVMEEMSHFLESTSTLNAVLVSVGELLRRALDNWNLQAYSSFWLLTYENQSADGEVGPLLRWREGFGPYPMYPSVKHV